MSRKSFGHCFILWGTLVLVALIGNLFVVGHSGAAEPLRIVTIQLRPFGFLEKEEPHGIHYELSNRILEIAGLQATNRIIP